MMGDGRTEDLGVPQTEKTSEIRGTKTPFNKTPFPRGGLLSGWTPGPGPKNNRILLCTYS